MAGTTATAKHRTHFREDAWLEHQRNQLRYTMLLKEAEEAERLAGEIFEDV